MNKETVVTQELSGGAPRRNSPGQKSAFTMIELVIVIAIMSMLAGLLLPALNKARQKAKVAKCTTTIGSVRTALAIYSLDYGIFPPSAESGGQVSDQHNGNSCDTALSGSPNNLVNAIQGTGGSGPYMEFKGKDLDEVTDPALPVLIDPWGKAYIYVCQKDILVANVHDDVGPFHPNATTDKNYNTYNIYSLGPDKITYGGATHTTDDDWDNANLIDNNGGTGEEGWDGDWSSTANTDDPQYDDVNSWDGTRGG